MIEKIYDWVDDRLDVTPIWRDIADHEVPGACQPCLPLFCIRLLLRWINIFHHCNSSIIVYVLNDVLCTGYRQCMEICLLPAA